MSIAIGKLEFQGPYSSASELKEEPGLYGIVCQIGDELELLNIDESSNLRDCLEHSEHLSNLIFYAETCRGRLAAIVHYTPNMDSVQRAGLKQTVIADIEAEER